MKRTSLILTIFILLILCGCQQVRYEAARVPRLPWPTEEYAQLQQHGDCTVTGQAFMKTRGGDVKVAAGSKVMLSPVTSYSTQFIDIIVRRTNGYSVLEPETADSRVFNYLKTQIGDAEGRFKFTNVAEGEYYLYTTVLWEVPSSTGLKRQGGWLWQKITVKNGAENNFILVK